MITGESEEEIKPTIFFNSTAGLDSPIILLLIAIIKIRPFLAAKFFIGYLVIYAISS